MHDRVSSVASLALHVDLTYGGGRQLVIRSGERVIAAHRSPSGACLQWLELPLSGDSGQLAAGSLPKTASSSPLRRECRPEPESPVPNALSGIFRLSAPARYDSHPGMPDTIHLAVGRGPGAFPFTLTVGPRHPRAPF